MSRKVLRLFIDLESAALADGFGELEVATILRTAAQKIEGGAMHTRQGGPLTPGYAVSLLDSNGVRVGECEIEEVGAPA